MGLTRITAKVIGSTSNLNVVSRRGVGYDHVDLAAPDPAGDRRYRQRDECGLQRLADHKEQSGSILAGERRSQVSIHFAFETWK